MPQFLLIGDDEFLNVEKILRVEIAEQANGKKKLRVWFSGRYVHEYTVPEDVESLLAFMKNNQADRPTK